jgi:hypothetical protein
MNNFMLQFPPKETDMKRIMMLSLLTVLMLGCDNPKSEDYLGSVRLEVTDAPFPFEAIAQANIIVKEIAVVGSGGVSTVDSQTRVYDLVQLQHGETAIMTTIALAPGSYQEFRLVVGDATITLTDGRSFSLKIPSGSSSGLKVKLSEPLVITSGLSERLVFDFDLSQSFKPIPNSAKKADDINSFTFHPVVRGAVVSDSGEVAGQVLLLADGTAVVGATVTITNLAGDFSQTSSTQDDGSFLFGFLPADVYEVTVETLDGLTTTSTSFVVTVGNRVNVVLNP